MIESLRVILGRLYISFGLCKFFVETQSISIQFIIIIIECVELLNKLRLDNDSRIHELYKISNNTTGTGMYFGKSSSGYLFQGVREIDPIETSMK